MKTVFADAYVEHLRSETFPAIATLSGFISASILRRPIARGIEFLVITHWASLESIRAFAGQNEEAAVVPAKVQGMMVEYDHAVRHFEVVQ